MARKMRGHTSAGWRQDQQKRSKERHERGLGAMRSGNPRYKLARVWSKKLGQYVHRYVLRSRR
ncbi:MAG: hypothetical protein KKD18_00380 [Nanoarchaeota archaeon]|nr:hypothetical protein [Nanoarchaeota archaeon]